MVQLAPMLRFLLGLVPRKHRPCGRKRCDSIDVSSSLQKSRALLDRCKESIVPFVRSLFVEQSFCNLDIFGCIHIYIYHVYDVSISLHVQACGRCQGIHVLHHLSCNAMLTSGWTSQETIAKSTFFAICTTGSRKFITSGNSWKKELWWCAEQSCTIQAHLYFETFLVPWPVPALFPLLILSSLLDGRKPLARINTGVESVNVCITIASLFPAWTMSTQLEWTLLMCGIKGGSKWLVRASVFLKEDQSDSCDGVATSHIDM